MSGPGPRMGDRFDAHPENDRAGWARLRSEFEVNLARAVIAHEPEHVDALQMLGGALTRLGRHAEALAVDRQVTRLAPSDPIAHYNLACSLSNLGAVDEAFGALERAVEFGYRDFGFLGKDPDLENVRKDARFEAFVARARQRGAKQTRGS